MLLLQIRLFKQAKITVYIKGIKVYVVIFLLNVIY